jgi:hypothetical protein
MLAQISMLSLFAMREMINGRKKKWNRKKKESFWLKLTQKRRGKTERQDRKKERKDCLERKKRTTKEEKQYERIKVSFLFLLVANFETILTYDST